MSRNSLPYLVLASSIATTICLSFGYLIMPVKTTLIGVVNCKFVQVSPPFLFFSNLWKLSWSSCAVNWGRVAAVHGNQMSWNLQASWMAAAVCYLKAKDGIWASFYTQLLILSRQTFLIIVATEAWKLTTPNIPDLHLSVLRILLMPGYSVVPSLYCDTNMYPFHVCVWGIRVTKLDDRNSL